MGSFGSAHQTYWNLYSKYPGWSQSRSASGSAAGGGEFRVRVRVRLGDTTSGGPGSGSGSIGVRVRARGSNAIIVYNTGVLEILWRTKKDMHRMLLVTACFQFWELVAAVETKPQKDNTHQLWTPRIKGYQSAPNLREQKAGLIHGPESCSSEEKIDLAMIPVKKHHHFGPAGVQSCSSFHHSRWRNSNNDWRVVHLCDAICILQRLSWGSPVGILQQLTRFQSCNTTEENVPKSMYQ